MSDPLPPEPEPTPPAPAPLPPVSPGAPRPSDPGVNWALLLHLSPLFGLLVCCAPGGTIAGPLIIWIIKRPESAELDAIGKRVLNFQLSYAIYSIVLGLASSVLTVAVGWLGIPLFVAWLAFTIIGAVKQNRGEVYQPPLTLDLIK